MATTTITALPTAATIDASQDWLAIDTTSLVTTQKINRNTYLGITSAPLGTTDAQSPTNKVFDNTNTFTIRDDRFTLQDNSDTTKQAQFQLSGITTATTRTYTLPNASSTLADISTAQTFTNKTLTNPAITGGTITNSTISVDAIAEFTAANGVTVDGMNIKDGKLNTNNSVITANITDGAVTPAKLVAGTGTGWALASYTPTLTNFAIGTGGNASNTAAYIQIGKWVVVRGQAVLGTSGASVGSGVTLTLPVTAKSGINSVQPAGMVTLVDSATAQYPGTVYLASTTTVSLQPWNAAGTNVTSTNGVTSTSPFTWGADDGFFYQFQYEAA